MKQGIRKMSALVKSRLARSSKIKLVSRVFIAMNPRPVNVVKPSMQPKQECGVNALFQFSIPS
jgi:hypothetical protein